VDPITLEDELRRSEKWEEVGELYGLQEVLFELDSAANMDHHVSIVLQHSERRAFLRLADQISKAALDPSATPDDLRARLTIAAEASQARGAITTGLEWIDAADFAAPLPAVNWMIDGLHVGQGRPAMVAGFGFSGKTLACQSLALQAAAGVKVWEHFRVPRQLNVRHVDSEQGRADTMRRYQRLAYANQIDLADLEGRLKVVSFPPLYLNQPGSEAAWRRAAEGVDLLILDSLRALTPGADENSSEMRRCLDPLTRISDETGCAFVVVHHSPKPSDQAKREGAHKLRGSSGIFDACGNVLLLEVNKGEQVRTVEQVKSPAGAAGGTIPKFYLAIEDVPSETSRPAGLRVVYRVNKDGEVRRPVK